MAVLDLACAIGSPFDIRQFSIRESLSSSFSIELLALAGEPNIDLESVVGKPASLRIAAGYLKAFGSARFWGGVCSHIELVQGLAPIAGSPALSTYFLRIVPRLWLLTQRRNHRIFQHLSIPDIADKILEEWQIKPTWKIDRQAYPKLEYKVQYGETDYAFLNRLLEEAGIAFALADDGESTALVLSDKFHAQPIRKAPPIPFEENPTEAAEREFVAKVKLMHDVRPGAHQIVDFDFRNPTFRLNGEANKAPAPESAYEQYEYLPGSFLVEGGKGGGAPVADDKGVARYESAYGVARADRSLGAERTGKRTVLFETNVIDLAPGVLVDIDHHPHDALAELLLVTSMEIHGTHDDKWDMRVSAVFAADRFLPPLTTPKPRVYGVQSATVVGPRGQEIYTDEFGRVRVQFPWDREGQFDDNSSCWMRVSQGWAGTGFGMINIPRIGQEVLVGFLDGDPEQPLVVGRVFNAVNPVPYKLPENKTVSGWKTHSSLTSGGYNEIKLEDNAGKELVYIQAQRDMHELVKRDETERIERHHHRTVLEDQHFIVKKTKKELVLVDDHLRVKGDRLQEIEKSTSLTIGVDQQEKVGNNHALDAGNEIHLKAGQKVVLEAGARLTIQGPGGFIDIHSGGIDIVGTMVRINSGGSAGKGSGSKPTKPADAEEAFPKDTSSE